MDYKNLFENLDNDFYTFKKEDNPIPKKRDLSYIVDENKTYSWNKEENIKHNNSIKDFKEKNRIKAMKLDQQFLKDLQKAIKKEFKVNNKVANIIIQEAQKDYNGSRYDLVFKTKKLGEIINFYNYWKKRDLKERI